MIKEGRVRERYMNERKKCEADQVWKGMMRRKREKKR